MQLIPVLRTKAIRQESRLRSSFEGMRKVSIFGRCGRFDSKSASPCSMATVTSSSGMRDARLVPLSPLSFGSSSARHLFLENDRAVDHLTR